MAMGKITQTEIKPHNKRYSKVNVPTKVTIITPAAGGDPPAIPEAAPPVLDTNKRKQLPAWIREGLEKMERDKLKQLEREKEKLANDEIAEKLKLEEKEKMEILRHTIKEKNLLKKSRFVCSFLFITYRVSHDEIHQYSKNYIKKIEVKILAFLLHYYVIVFYFDFCCIHV